MAKQIFTAEQLKSVYGEPQAVQQQQQVEQKSLGNKLATGAKAFVGGVASGVGGAVLTAQDYLARKAVNALPEGTTIAGVSKEQMQANLANAPKLQDQLKQEFGGEEAPIAFGAGELGGQIATLAAPASAAGRTVGTATTKALGTRKGAQLAGKLAQAGTEGVVFTAGQGLAQGEKQSFKDFALNAGLNMVFPAAGAVAKKVGETAPARIINSLIKPLQKDFAYGKNPGKTVAELGIVANDFDELIPAIRNAKNAVGENIGTLTQKALPQLQSQMDLNTYLSPIDEALAIANKSPRTNATVISRLESVKADLVDNINQGVDPQSFKGLVGDLTRWTGNASDDAIVNKALKQVYGKTASGMDDVLKNTLTPEEFAQYKKSAEQYGNLISAENAATYRDNIVKRSDLISFGAKNSALIAALGTAVASGGSGLTTIIAGLAGAGVDKAMATPAFKTRLAGLLSKLAPKEVQTFFDRVPGAKTLYRQEQIDNLVNQAKKNLKNPSNAQGGFINLGGKSDDLINEAKKYKSAEEFIKAQGKPLYHGSTVPIKTIDTSRGYGLYGKGFYVSENQKSANLFGQAKKGGVVSEIVVSPNAKFINMKTPKDYDELIKKVGEPYKWMIKNGYDGINVDGFAKVIVNPDIVKTKSQLEEIWKKANNKK